MMDKQSGSLCIPVHILSVLEKVLKRTNINPGNIEIKYKENALTRTVLPICLHYISLQLFTCAL